VICVKAMEKAPERRYRTMQALADDLRRYLTGDVIQAKPAGPATRLLKRIKRNPVLTVAIGAAGACMVTLIVFMVFSFVRDKIRLQEIRRQSDRNLIVRLKVDAEMLWPAYPENAAALRRWVGEAERLAANLDSYRSSLGELAAAAHLDEEEALLRDLLQELVSGIVSLVDEEAGLLGIMQKRLHFAEHIREESIEKHRDAWDRALSSIADPGECPMYDGIRIEPQIGLVPLERDRASGLWEFAHLQTGAPPKRGEHGKFELTEETGLVFVLLPGGTFSMGAQSEDPQGLNFDPEAGPWEGPVHEVTIPPFFLSKYEMTQGQWLRFTGERPSAYGPNNYNPAWSREGAPYSLLHPVEQVSWERCANVLYRLKLRLPTEAEWEYAVRAGTITAWWTGDERESLEGAVNLADRFCQAVEGPSGSSFETWLDDGFLIHAPVGSFLPNGFGLHDVCGNVCEWCRDAFGSYSDTPLDGSAHESEASPYRVFRGGSWFEDAGYCRSADRHRQTPKHFNHTLGLRAAASVQ
jgi:formylglycine-generating enzyme required for sulfatase activity